MIRDPDKLARFEAEDSARQQSHAAALATFTGLWVHARELNPAFGSDWQAVLEPDFAVARAINGLPPLGWAMTGSLLGVPALGPGELHVWTGPLGVPPSSLERYRRTLTKEEADRADRYASESDARRSIAARGILREILGGYLGTAPASLQFAYGANGKPALAGASLLLHFNLAHSGDLMLIAIARAEVGVDVEAIMPLGDMDDVAARYLTQAERRRIAQLPAADQPRAFFESWVCKEASIKAFGGVLSDEGRPEWIRAVFEPEPGFVAAVASPAALEVRCLRWPPKTA